MIIAETKDMKELPENCCGCTLERYKYNGEWCAITFTRTPSSGINEDCPLKAIPEEILPVGVIKEQSTVFSKTYFEVSMAYSIEEKILNDYYSHGLLSSYRPKALEFMVVNGNHKQIKIEDVLDGSIKILRLEEKECAY